MIGCDRTMHGSARLVVLLGAIASACLASTDVLAASNYSVKVSVPKTVKAGKKFTVNATGVSKDSSGLDVFLDGRKCAATDAKEHQQDSSYQPGYSYLSVSGPAGTFKQAFEFFVVSGQFKKAPTAHAGTHTGPQNVCVYVLSEFTGKTRAHASTAYTVTK